MCAILLIALELGSSYVVRRYSVTYARVTQQYAAAVKVRPGAPEGPTSVLLLGNSLLLDGIDLDRLQKLTSDSLRISPIFLEGTGYYDWRYGLDRLLRQGARPQVVVVGMEARFVLSNGVWEESPMLLLDARDVFRVASNTGLDRTATSDLLLSHMSTFWGMRSFFRRRILLNIVPGFADLFPYLRSGDLSVSQDPKFEATVRTRLGTLREICAAHGARLILLIPPTRSSQDATRWISLAAQQAGVEALVPVDPEALPAKFYEPDEIHLNPEGAAHFTSALAAELSRTIVAQQQASLRPGASLAK